MANKKRKSKMVLKVQQRKRNAEERKMESELSFIAEQSLERKSSLSSDDGKKDPDFGLHETSKKKHI